VNVPERNNNRSKSNMSTAKLNPQPDPPMAVSDFLGWLSYIFDWVWWIIWLPFSYIF
jgi:hypothetical protein